MRKYEVLTIWLLFISTSLSLGFAILNDFDEKPIQIVEKNGFMVVKEKDIPNQSKIMCKVKDLNEYGFEQFSENKEYVCQNLFDDLDFTIIEDEKSEFDYGDTLQVTFIHDDVKAIEKFETDQKIEINF